MEFTRWQSRCTTLKERCSTASASLKLCDNQAFPNISLLLRVFATIPVTSASAERSFSNLRLVKTTRGKVDRVVFACCNTRIFIYLKMLLLTATNGTSTLTFNILRFYCYSDFKYDECPFLFTLSYIFYIELCFATTTSDHEFMMMLFPRTYDTFDYILLRL